VYGAYITDPVELVSRISLVPVLILGAITFSVATLGINVVANFVSAAYDLSNLVPKKLDFRRAGLVAAVLALLVMPWKLYSSPVAVNYFLGTLGAFLGPLFGILMTDYFLFRKQRVAVEEMYRLHGGYSYTGGVNVRALISFGVAAAVAAPIALLGTFAAAAPFAWPIGVVIGAALYYVLMIGQPVIGEPPAPEALAVPEPVAER
jgi:NCS1 family nucleobase:cation symporter-1